jgi:membrane-associated phospholipid phosphatase
MATLTGADAPTLPSVRPAEVIAATGPAVRRVASELAEAATTDPADARAIGPVDVLPPRVVVQRTRLEAIAAIAGFLGFGVLFGLVRRGRTAAFDAALTLRIQARQHRVINSIMAAASWPGFPPQSRLIPPAIITALALARLRIEALCLTIAWGTALVSTVIKAFMKRPRPVAGTDLRVVAAPLGGSSFPSGHVITFVGFYGFLAILAHALVRRTGLRRAIVAGLTALVALVGPSRIQQGHHWPTDVTASYLLGTSYLIGVLTLFRRLKARSARTQR